MFKCNCPHETRAGCSEPQCPHYAKPRATRDGAEGAGDIEHLKNVGENGYCNMTAGEAYKKGFAAGRKAAPPQPAPDAVRELLIREFSQFPNRDGVGRHVAIVDWFLSRLAAPVPSPDGAMQESDFENIALSNGWYRTVKGWHHPNAEQYSGWVGYPITYLTARAVCEANGLSPSPAVAAEPVAHYHNPSTMHMGDCSVCGNVSDHPMHIGSPSFATPPVRGDREAIARTNLIRDSIQRVYDEMCVKFSGVHLDDETDNWLLNLHASLKLLSLPVQSAPDRAILSKHFTKAIADRIIQEWNDALRPIIRKYASDDTLDGIWQEIQEARNPHFTGTTCISG